MSQQDQKQLDKHITMKIRHCIVAILLIGISSLFLAMGLMGFPGMHSDADLFVPITLNVGANKGWVVDGYTPLLLRQNGSNTYAGHGFIFPFIIGRVLGTSSGAQLYLWCGIINAGAFLLYFFAAQNTWADRGRKSLTYSLLLGICAGVIGISLQGRPEQLALLIIPIPLLISVYWESQRVYLVISTVTISVLSSISPLLGFYYWIGLASYLAFSHCHSPRRHLKLQALCIISSLAMYSILILILTSSSPIKYIESIFKYGRSPFVQGHHILSLGSLITQAPFWQLPLLTLAGYSLVKLFRLGRFFVALVLALPLILMSRLVGTYIYLSYVPLCILLINKELAPSESKSNRVIIRTIVVFLSLYAIILIRYSYLGVLYLTTDAKYSDAERQITSIHTLAKSHNNVVGYGTGRFPSLAIFGNPSNELIAVDARTRPDYLLQSFETLKKQEIEFVILPQEGQLASLPPQALDSGRYKLLSHNWTGNKARLFNIRIGGYGPGYRYAVYKKIRPSKSHID